MHLAHLPLDKLSIATVNMRHHRRPPDISDLVPSVRARGVLVPLLVRPSNPHDCSGDTAERTYEIVAGRRRYFAAKLIAAEADANPELPCAIMEPGDDAAALEASLIENLARQDADAMTQYEAFVKLIKQGRTISDIAATFGLSETAVKQRLALGNLLPKLREAYRRDEIDADTIRHLTLASKTQQRDWLALFEDPEAYAPRGAQVKQWLFGGSAIATSVALFPLDEYRGEIVADLFGDNSYFADAEHFWSLQHDAVAAKREAYLAAGWREVAVLEPGAPFHVWQHEKTPKRKGGRVYIQITANGAVTCHEGYLTREEADKRRRHAEDQEDDAAVVPMKADRPEVSAALQSYIDLHRQAAVRAPLLDRPDIALRLMVAHAIGGSPLWCVEPEPQRAGRDDIAGSLAASPAQAAYCARRADIQALLGLEAEDGPVVSSEGVEATVAIFANLLALSDIDVLRVLAFVMAETLAAGTALVEAAGLQMRTDMAAVWQPDEVFFDLLRDKPAITAMLVEVAGAGVAEGNRKATAKVQKQIIRDCLTGSHGRDKAEGWLPGWLAFPPRAYTERGGVRAVTDAAAIQSVFPVG